MKTTLTLTCLLFSGLVSSANAALVIDFGTGTAGAGGSVTALAGGNASGSQIALGTLTVTNGASVSTYDTSGTATSSNQDANLSAALSFNTATNTISIIGGIPTLGIANGTTLLTGTFSSFTLTNLGTILSVQGAGPDTKSPVLLAALGIPLTTQFQFFGFTISSQNLTGGGFTAFSSDIANTGVPEPASILLLGTVFVGVARILRRRAA